MQMYIRIEEEEKKHTGTQKNRSCHSSIFLLAMLIITPNQLQETSTSTH
jgi:hypothetical protein